MRSEQIKLRHLTRLALLFALCLVFAYLERLLPPPPLPVPVRYGLANIVVMVALFLQGPRAALALVLLKALAQVFMASPLAGLLSLVGGLCSWLLMTLLLRLGSRRPSLFLTSAAGALAHSFAQAITVLAFFSLYEPLAILALAGPLMLFSLFSAFLTAAAVRLVIPALEGQFKKEL